MTTKVLPNTPLTLRVRQNSEMDRLIRAFMDHGGPLSTDELKEIGGLSRSAWLASKMDNWFDNVRVVRTHDDDKSIALSYQDIQPRPVAIAQEVVSSVEITVPQEDAPTASDIRWPQAPPIIVGLGDKFREPSWFKTMKMMVDAGRHIALAGPPGVGKDTAVQELAAREGRILVTVGGDAGFRRRDLVGTTQISKGSSFLDVAEYATAVVSGWWVLLTEVNAADADALMFINTQLAPPYVISIGGRAYPVHPDFRLFVSYNPGLVGTKPLPQSFKDRFFSIKVPFFSKAQLRNILVAHGMDDNAVWCESVLEYGLRMWDAHERGQMRYQITSRRLMDAVVLMNLDGFTIKEAMSMAVIDSIDSPVEANVAKQILNSIGGV